jgi:hypothetical protein
MSYYEGQNDAPGGVTETASQTEAAYASAMATCAAEQADTARFIVESGALAGGHADVGIPAGSQTWAAGHAPYSQPPN